MQVEFTQTAAAAYLGIGRKKFIKIVNAGSVRYLQIKKRKKFYKSDLDLWKTIYL